MGKRAVQLMVLVGGLFTPMLLTFLQDEWKTREILWSLILIFNITNFDYIRLIYISNKRTKWHLHNTNSYCLNKRREAEVLLTCTCAFWRTVWFPSWTVCCPCRGRIRVQPCESTCLCRLCCSQTSHISSRCKSNEAVCHVSRKCARSKWSSSGARRRTHHKLGSSICLRTSTNTGRSSLPFSNYLIYYYHRSTFTYLRFTHIHKYN